MTKMRTRTSKSLVIKAVGAVIVILVTVSTYLFLGVYINTQGIVIYDKFPEDFWTVDNEKKLTCNVWNKAPLSLPFFVPYYSFKVIIEDEQANEYAYFIGSGSIERDFANWYLDLGKIESGSKREVDFTLHLDENDIKFRVEISLSVLNLKKNAGSVTYNVQYMENYRYNISRG